MTIEWRGGVLQEINLTNKLLGVQDFKEKRRFLVDLKENLARLWQKPMKSKVH